MITVNDVSVQFSGTTLFSNVSFAINENDKIALMGKNGAGKSTLLKIVAGATKPTSGSITAPKEAVIAYLPQHLLASDNATVFEETSKAFAEITKIKVEIEDGETSISLEYVFKSLMVESRSFCSKLFILKKNNIYIETTANKAANPNIIKPRFVFL